MLMLGKPVIATAYSGRLHVVAAGVLSLPPDSIWICASQYV